MNELKNRLAPFLALLDARYLPLLFAASPQAYVVYVWLWTGSDRSYEAWLFAIAGALGYEMVYVGAIAWAEGQTSGRWVWGTALVALAFSIAVACYTYWSKQSYAAILHDGFPLVAFCYTMTIHSAAGHRAAPQPALTLPRQETYPPPVEVKEDAPDARAVCIDATSHACPKCGASLDPARWRAARRWGHCAACKAR